MSFEKLEIIDPIKKALLSEGYEIPTPIQKQAIPKILEGCDILGSAQTGTGKTAAFAVPILQMLYGEKDHTQFSFPIQALILSPTRELALQIKESFATYGRFTGLKTIVVFGGVPQRPQTEAIRKGVDILVATPGRLLDLLEQKVVDLNQIKIFVLDEADRMLDMGFIHDIKKVIKVLPEKRQNLLFSATLAPEIATLAGSFLHDPVTIEIEPESPTLDAITQGVYFVAKPNKRKLLIHVLQESEADSIIVFTRTKYGADNLTRYLKAAGIVANAIHSDKAQSARQNALKNFKGKKIRVLVATDIAARGLDIEQLAMVINYDIPNIPDSYIHRIGRTGRAGLTGVALSFCDGEEKAYLKDIQKLLKAPIPVMSSNPFALDTSAEESKDLSLQKKPQRGRGNHPANKNNQANKPQERRQQHHAQKNAGHAEAAKTHADPNTEKTGTHSAHHVQHKKNDDAQKTDHQRKPFVKHAAHGYNKTEQKVHPNKINEEQRGKSNAAGTNIRKQKSKAWRNDASYENRFGKHTYEKKKDKTGFNQEGQKKQSGNKSRTISNEYKPDHNRTGRTTDHKPKKEKLTWLQRLGFGKKKKNDGRKN